MSSGSIAPRGSIDAVEHWTSHRDLAGYRPAAAVVARPDLLEPGELDHTVGRLLRAADPFLPRALHLPPLSAPGRHRCRAVGRDRGLEAVPRRTLEQRHHLARLDPGLRRHVGAG